MEETMRFWRQSGSRYVRVVVRVDRVIGMRSTESHSNFKFKVNVLQLQYERRVWSFAN